MLTGTCSTETIYLVPILVATGGIAIYSIALKRSIMTRSLPKAPKKKLRMNEAQFLRYNPSYDKVVVAAANAHTGTKEICLLKRNADEINYPNVFELPSRNVDPTDSSLLSALKREVKEETGFKIRQVVLELDLFEYYTEKMVEEKMVRKSCI